MNLSVIRDGAVLAHIVGITVEPDRATIVVANATMFGKRVDIGDGVFIYVNHPHDMNNVRDIEKMVGETVRHLAGQ